MSPGDKLGISIYVSPAARSSNQQDGHEIASLLGGRYSLTRRIAVGGMGEVWAATDTVLGREVAVKILRDDLVDSPVFLERFRAEARHTASLAHRGIASVYDYGEDRSDGRLTAYLVMELVDGQPLSKVMGSRGVLPVNMVLSILAQTSEALHAAHVSGVIHRDVKPGNLLLLDDGTIKVTDFGIARAASSAALTEVGQVIGTARYISPEQAMGVEATPASDIYSLGVIGYEMLAGHPPFTAENAGALAMAHVHQAPPPLPTTVPTAVSAAIGDALSKDPADRPRDAHAFAARLRRLQLAGMPPPERSADVEAGDSQTTLFADAGSTQHTNDGPASTQVMSEGGGESRTAVMPPGIIVGRAPQLGMSQEPYAARRQRRRLAAALLVAAAVVAGLILLSGRSQAPHLDLPTATSTPKTVTVDAKSLLGLPAATASALLSKAGFVVVLNHVDVQGVAGGVVTAVAPSGQVPEGATVTLDVSNENLTSTTTTVATKHAKGNGKPKGKPNG